VAEGLAQGWEVAAFNRGRTGEVSRGAETIIGDRLDPDTLRPLTDRDWDLVVDTWSGVPRAVRDSAGALRDRAAFYAYVSSISVYTSPPPIGVTESDETVNGSRDADAGEYAEVKRGAELAVEDAFPGRSLLARAGLILGPHENVGRLTWWLSRMARGGEVLCPGPREMGIQYVDARDLARFVIAAGGAGDAGPFNVVSRRGHATMGTLLDVCRAVAGAADTALTWVDPDVIEQAGIEPWQELPVWLPPDHEYAGMHAADVERAYRAGLTCRPVEETVSDTWRWLSSLAGPPRVTPGRPAPGLDPERERATLAAWHVTG
jgi:2'-hydroxyisoflavone reductase